MSGLQVTTAWADDHCAIVLAGEARLETIEMLDDVTREVEARGMSAVLVDLGAVQFMDSASTGSLLRLHGRMEALGGKLVLHSLPRMIQRLFERLGLRQLHIAADATAARERL